MTIMLMLYLLFISKHLQNSIPILICVVYLINIYKIILKVYK